MALTYDPNLSAIWTDYISVYRPDKRDINNEGGHSGVRAVTGAQTVLCAKHDTDNYDEASAAGFQVKQNNIMTSDKVSCPLGLDVRAEDIVKIVSADGRTEWFTVAGAPKSRPRIPHIKVFLTAEKAPAIIGGAWVS